MRWLGLPLGHAREMFAGISYEGMKMLSNLSVKMCELKLLALNFLLVELRNKAAHVFEVCCRLIHYALYESVPFWVKVFWVRQTKGGPYVGAGSVIPETDISQRDFMPQQGLVGGLAWWQKFERDFRDTAESNGKKFCGLGGVIPWGGGKAREPLRDLGVYSLQGLDLGFHSGQGRFDTAFSGFALRVKIHRLPDSDAGQNNRHNSRYEADNFHNSPKKI